MDASSGNEFVDIEYVSPSVPPTPAKRMRGSVHTDGERLLGSYHSRPKFSASKPSRSPDASRKQQTVMDDPSNWAIVVYKPRGPPFNLLESVPQTARKRLPKPSAIRKLVPGMRIRGCTGAGGPESDGGRKYIGFSNSKRKTSHEPIVISSDSESETDVVEGARSLKREVLTGERREVSTSESPEESSKQVANVVEIGRRNMAEPKYASRDPRARVKQVIELFDNLRRRFLREEESRSKSSEKGKGERADLKAYFTLKEKNYRVNGQDSILGDVPGVRCGDHFYYRLELYIIALHCQIQAGIDFIPASKSTYRDRNGNVVPVAVSVIASGAYEDDKDEGDILIYTGQGGNICKGGKGKGTDQELTRGNLALKNNRDLGLPVRVIRGNDVKKTLGSSSPSGKIYYYDGLYDVTDCYQEVGTSGNKVWKYKLVRREGQGELISELVTFKGISRLPRALLHKGEKVLLDDISNGKEPKKVRVVGCEDDELPERFQYNVKIKYPRDVKLEPANTCSCTRECWDRCPCLKWNHGEPPYNENGSLVRGKKAVYECGPKCSCGNECYNRVSQKGLRFDLEVFKTKGKGWGVRSSSYIPQGSFICEYIGEVVHTSEAELRVSTDDYLFDLNVPQSQEKRFGDISGLVEDINDADGSEEDDPSCERWTIDAHKYGNVARFINHSCDGNLFVQCVFYEHHDLRFPHIMLFAMEKISPYTELNYDYGAGRRMRLEGASGKMRI